MLEQKMKDFEKDEEEPVQANKGFSGPRRANVAPKGTEIQRRLN
jgi:hypothetical protein